MTMGRILLEATVVLVGLIIATVVGHFITVRILKRLSFKEKTGLKRAGEIIGYLERILVYVAVLVGSYELVGFALASKSIARFEELKKREFAEYFLVGTLTSTLSALITGILARMVLEIIP